MSVPNILFSDSTFTFNFPDHNRLYRTGDFGTIVNGVLTYEGRNDSQIKVRGHRVDLADIDFALNKIKGISNAVVLCYKPGEIDQVS